MIMNQINDKFKSCVNFSLLKHTSLYFAIVNTPGVFCMNFMIKYSCYTGLYSFSIT